MAYLRIAPYTVVRICYKNYFPKRHHQTTMNNVDSAYVPKKLSKKIKLIFKKHIDAIDEKLRFKVFMFIIS